MSEISLHESEYKDDMVNRPGHYISDTGIETIDVIEAFTKDLEPFEAYCTGNIIKYICRWKHKNGLEDLKKARWYINRLLGEDETEEPKVVYGSKEKPICISNHSDFEFITIDPSNPDFKWRKVRSFLDGYFSFEEDNDHIVEANAHYHNIADPTSGWNQVETGIFLKDDYMVVNLSDVDWDEKVRSVGCGHSGISIIYKNQDLCCFDPPFPPPSQK